VVMTGVVSATAAGDAPTDAAMPASMARRTLDVRRAWRGTRRPGASGRRERSTSRLVNLAVDLWFICLAVPS